MTGLSAFDALLRDRLVPEFCADETRRCTPEGFISQSNRVGQRDANDFMSAWDAGIIEHKGRGLYRAPNSKASERFFWDGARAATPRTYTLWLEPIITVAVLGRLHLQYGWPKTLIGCQSDGWAFDATATLSGRAHEHIACEVKKSQREVDVLLDRMIVLGRAPDIEEPAKSDKSRNAYKKVAALRKGRPPVFWAVGPERYEMVYRMSYAKDGVVQFEPADDALLAYPSRTAGSL